jgi:uncharacterized protein YgiM (DUF1202 family)
MAGALAAGSLLAAPPWAASQIPNPVAGLTGLFKGATAPTATPGATPSLASSTTSTTRDEASCEAGGALGGMLGASMFKNNALATAAGGLGGCLVARQIARQLTKDERVELQNKTAEVFENSTPSVTYQSEEKHKTVTITRSEDVVQPKTWQLDALADVTPPHDGFNVVAKTYYAKTKVNLRAFTSTDAEILGAFKPNQAVYVMGRTYDGAWNLIGSDDVLVGYAATSLFTSAPLPPEAAKAKPAAKPTLAKGQSMTEATKAKVTVNTSTTCSQVKQQVGTATGMITGCKSPNGGWDLA